MTWLLTLILVPLLLAGCVGPEVLPPEARDARIAIRSVGGIAEFYDKVTGEAFVPRGHNFVKYTFSDDPINGSGYLDMVMSPRRYDAAEYRADLEAMAALGFNVIRVMLETCAASDCIYPTGGTDRGLSGAYLDAVVDLLDLAAEVGVYVWLTSNTLPDEGYYLQVGYSGAAGLISESQATLMAQSGIDAYTEYFTDLFQGLIARDARLDHMFSFSIRNEYWYDNREQPWPSTAGDVTTATGATYDMAVQSEREALAEETLIETALELGRPVPAPKPRQLQT